MSALRLGLLPDGTRDVRLIDEGAVGRVRFARYGIRNIGGSFVAPVPVVRVVGVYVDVPTPASLATRQRNNERKALARGPNCRAMVGNPKRRCALPYRHDGKHR